MSSLSNSRAMDPSMVYDGLLPVKIDAGEGTARLLRVRMFMKSDGGSLPIANEHSGNGTGAPRRATASFKIELTDDKCPRYLQTLSLAEGEYPQLKADLRLMVDFPSFPSYLSRLFAQCGGVCSMGGGDLHDGGEGAAAAGHAGESPAPARGVQRDSSGGSGSATFIAVLSGLDPRRAAAATSGTSNSAYHAKASSNQGHPAGIGGSAGFRGGGSEERGGGGSLFTISELNGYRELIHMNLTLASASEEETIAHLSRLVEGHKDRGGKLEGELRKTEAARESLSEQLQSAQASVAELNKQISRVSEETREKYETQIVALQQTLADDTTALKQHFGGLSRLFLGL
eukprot:GHVU01071757.1.p1 GENE.GHVU01071757.1~~GHVU01071757.1.p1  ORF type:complete len:344 (+),score=72.58 GHVU01071757.1:29-1060(+)